MKKLIMALAITASFNAAADCSVVYNYAKTTMTARQDGISFRVLMAEVDKIGAAPRVESMLKTIVQAAYSKPMHESRQRQTRAILDFAYDTQQACLRVGR